MEPLVDDVDDTPIPILRDLYYEMRDGAPVLMTE